MRIRDFFSLIVKFCLTNCEIRAEKNAEMDDVILTNSENAQLIVTNVKSHN